ncbi:Na+/H+ antiporter NhaA [Monashia sp. NPDC004114]
MSEPSKSTLWRAMTLRPRSGRGAPLRDFLLTESGSAGVLAAAIALALVWANLSQETYESFWTTRLSITLGDHAIDEDLRGWLNNGLMTFFFLVVGLEARREFDLGDLRERRRFVLPLVAGLTGMAVPIGIYLAINAGHGTTNGWGVAMSTDTALALGMLALLGTHAPERARVFLVTILVVDDLAALVVIAIAYSGSIHWPPLLVAAAVFALLLYAVRLRVQQIWVYVLIWVALWLSLRTSGIDPIVAGLVIGLACPAYTPSRGDLEDATGLVRRFREEPTIELARSARTGLLATLSPNARLQAFYHPWTSYLIVPLFALANAGITLDPGFLGQAYAAPVTIGVIVGYVVGKPVAIVAASKAVTVLSRGRIRPPVGWGVVLGSGTIAGIGFTVALLVASRAFHDTHLAEAKLGALTAAALAAAITWVVYRLIGRLPDEARARALVGDLTLIQDLVPEVDVEHDHVRGPVKAPITVIEFGDFQCPHCGQAEPAVRELLADDTDIRYVWRHLPLTDVHPQAQLAAEASEAAAAQGAFWPMHDLLLARQEHLRFADLLRYADELGLDTARFETDLRRRRHETRVARDVESADLSGVAGTPTFFINGQRHHGAFDLETLTGAVRTARDALRVSGSR